MNEVVAITVTEAQREYLSVLFDDRAWPKSLYENWSSQILRAVYNALPADETP